MKCISCLEFCVNHRGNLFSCTNGCLIITKREDLIMEYDALFKYKESIYRLYSDSYYKHTNLYKYKFILSNENLIPDYNFNDYNKIIEVNYFFESDIFDENFLFNLVDKLLLLKNFS